MLKFDTDAAQRLAFPPMKAPRDGLSPLPRLSTAPRPQATSRSAVSEFGETEYGGSSVNYCVSDESGRFPRPGPAVWLEVTPAFNMAPQRQSV